ncbi:MAG: Hemoglobin-like protein, partial [Phycisphaerales bacterium]|nr:Hemoglobin-like protein [Phycisphaerales bacterium]
MKIRRAPLALALACLLFAGCNDHKAPPASKSNDMSMSKPMMATRSLYDRLGGEPAITAVIDDFVNRAAGDPKVNFTRKGTDKEWPATPENVAKLKKHLTQFVCMATGGPQKYEGKPMKPVHAGMKITEAEFGAIAADLIASLDKF